VPIDRLANLSPGVHDVGEGSSTDAPSTSRREIVRNVLIGLCLFALVASFALDAAARLADGAKPQLAHMVFFALKDHSKDSRDRFIASCEKYLADHEGTVYFSVGTIAEDEDVLEPVSVKDFDVALHVVFDNKAAKAKYLASERHKTFVDENRESFAGVRVFDSFLKAPSKPGK
jgi:Stress responsive A/B Barrel Domain